MKKVIHSGLYNAEKLTPVFKCMKDKKIAVIGGGAIGSIICELLVTNGAGYVAVIDKDYYEIDNLVKSSKVIRMKEDINESKARVLANRLSPYLKDGCHISGFNMDLKCLGPLAFLDFDYVILALDNLAMKIFSQVLIKQCKNPPILLSCGTTREHSEALAFSPNGACLRCTVSDDWLLSESPETVHSCAEKINYLLPQKALSTISTSGVAGMKAALDIDDMIVGLASGNLNLLDSINYFQDPYPYKNGHSAKIAKLEECPVCSLVPPSNPYELKGSTKTTTLSDILFQIQDYFTGEFRLRVHSLTIPGIPEQIYNQFVISDTCSVCGNPFKIMKHTGSIRKSELVCNNCNSSRLPFTNNNVSDIADNYVSWFSLKDTPKDILEMSLFELGYPIGCYYEAEPVEVELTPTQEMTVLTVDNLISGDDENRTFYLNNDISYLHHNLRVITG